MSELSTNGSGNVVPIQTTTKSATEIGKELDAKIPRDAVSQREGGGKRKLSYLESWYVIDRMNKVFGHLNWSCETIELRELKTEKPSYLARVRIMISLADGRAVMKDGVGYGSDKNGLNPHEMAAKEAESDAFKRAAKNFGLSLGLALYAKDEDLIDDGQDDAKAAPPVSADRGSDPAQVRVEGVSGEHEASKPTSNEGPTREQINKLITETSKVIAARKIQTTAQLKKYVKDTFGVDSKEELNDEQANQLYTYLKGVLNG